MSQRPQKDEPMAAIQAARTVLLRGDRVLPRTPEQLAAAIAGPIWDHCGAAGDEWARAAYRGALALYVWWCLSGEAASEEDLAAAEAELYAMRGGAELVESAGRLDNPRTEILAGWRDVAGADEDSKRAWVLDTLLVLRGEVALALRRDPEAR